jgi:alkylation response protein AidB-like acyl-CoA dehydrogenase
MRFALNDDERLASDTARELFRELAGVDAATVPLRLQESGWFDVVRDGGPVVGLLAAEQAGWCALGFPFTEQALAVPAALASAGRNDHSSVGSGLGLMAPAGVSAASDGLRGREPLKAARGPAGWTVNGSAWPVVASPGVASWLAVAQCDEGDSHGLYVTPREQTYAMRSLDPAVQVWRVEFAGAESLGERLPPQSLGALLDWGAAGAAAEMLGAAQRLLDMSVDHAKHRIQFGRPVGSFQAVKHHCANMHVIVETMRASVWGAAAALSSSASASEAVSIAKSYCGPAARRVASTALQVHGGIGFTSEHALHHHLKRIERLATEFGDARWHRARLMGEHQDSVR